MKETKEMMRILSENKKKAQEKSKELKKTKDKATDVIGVTWMCVAMVIIFTIIAQI